MNDASAIAPYMQLVYYAIAAMAAFAAVVASTAGVVFLILRAKLDDRYMTRREFTDWVDAHDKLYKEIVDRLELSVREASASAKEIGKVATDTAERVSATAADAANRLSNEISQIRGIIFEVLGRGKG